MQRKIYTAIIAIVLFIPCHLFSQNICKENPYYCKVLSSTDSIRISMIKLSPSAKLTFADKDVYAVYVITGGLVTRKLENGNSDSLLLEQDDFFSKGIKNDNNFPQTLDNGGNTTIRVLLIENLYWNKDI